LVTQASTTIAPPNIGGSITAGTQLFFSSEMVTSAVSGVVPTGTITFFDGANALMGHVTLTGQAGSAGAFSNLAGSSSTAFATSGVHQLTASYSGDSNYAASTSAPATISIFYPTNALINASSVLVNLGQSVTLTATVTSTYKSPAMTGVFQFTGDGSIAGQITPSLGTDANGNQVLTATVIFTPQTFEGIGMTYSGDANFNQSSAFISVNVIVPDFSIAATTPSLNIAAGQSGMAVLNVMPLSNVSSSVALSCSFIAISGVACAFNPGSSVALANGAPTAADVTISTLPPSLSMTTQFAAPRSPRSRGLPPPGQRLLAVADGLAILLLCGLSFARRSRIAASFGMLALLGSLLSCGGSSTSIGGGGGGGQSSPSLTLTTSAVKVPYQATFTLTATANSGTADCSTVLFVDSATNGFPGFFVPLTNGTASVALNNETVGTHIISAQCGGDVIHPLLKTNGSLNVVVTGSAPVTVQGTTSYVTHTMPINVTIQ
jgi:Bacterial Ig-like domain (group 3)